MPRALERPNRYFTFLRRLRAEGRSNMYGAIPYLASAFGIDRTESFRIVCEWIDAQDAVAADAGVPKAAVPAERAAEPTLFDPVPTVKSAPRLKPAAASKPPSRKPPRNAEVRPVASVKKGSKRRTGAPKKPRRPSDSRAA
jgi:hypothetical protein